MVAQHALQIADVFLGFADTTCTDNIVVRLPAYGISRQRAGWAQCRHGVPHKTEVDPPDETVWRLG
jgi:hypothetical protein